jgi:hypothetical protein
MMRDSMNVVVVQGIMLERGVLKRENEVRKTPWKLIDGPFHLHLTIDMVR